MAAERHFAAHPAHLAQLRAAALQAVDPAAAVRRHWPQALLAEFDRVFIVGLGKAGVAMSQAAAMLLGDQLAAGVIAVPQVPATSPARLQFVAGGHPMPSEGSLEAGAAIAALLTQVTERDGVLALISGGGSALCERLRPGLSLADLQHTNQVLLRCGAPIQAMNRVRQRLSQLKGGGLLRLAHPARVVALILSDIIGNPLELIASGPTVPAPTADLAEIIGQYGLRAQLPAPVLAALDAPLPFAEGPAPHANLLIASNQQACAAVGAMAEKLGFRVIQLGDDWQGEARETGPRFAERLLAERANAPVCVIAGGETTVTVRGTGRGGRNQEAALSAAFTLAGQPQVALCTFGTDGVDGPTDAAGACVTGETLACATALGLDPAAALANNDAYPFFATLGDLIRTGPTGTNVNDVWVGLAY